MIEENGQRRFVLFAALLAVAALFHMEPVHFLRASRSAPQLLAGVAVVVAALGVLARPRSLPRLLLLSLAQVGSVAVDLPSVPNHWLLAGLLHLTLLLAAGRAFLRDRTLPGDGGAFLRPLVGALRLGVALFYGFTCLWKLNHDFFDLQRSCAVRGWASIAGLYGWPTGGATSTAIVAVTVVLEGGAPFLLLWRRTRGWTALVMVLFHFGLGLDILHRYLNFSSLMFALLTLSLSPAMLARARRRLPMLARWPTATRRAAAGMAALFTIVIVAPADPRVIAGHFAVRYLAFMVLSLATVALFGAAVFGRPLSAMTAETPSTPRAAWRRLGYVFPVLVLLIGCGPLLGVRNRGSWQMYSNLRLEPDASNHFLFPRSLDLLHLMADRVTIRATSDRNLSAYVTAGLDLPWITFRGYLSQHPQASVRYFRDGRETIVARVSDDPELSRAPPWPARALFFLRPLGDGVRAECLW